MFLYIGGEALSWPYCTVKQVGDTLALPEVRHSVQLASRAEWRTGPTLFHSLLSLLSSLLLRQFIYNIKCLCSTGGYDKLLYDTTNEWAWGSRGSHYYLHKRKLTLVWMASGSR